MKKLIYSVAAVAALCAGGAWAQADAQAGSAWRSNEDPVTIPQGNSGWSPPWGYDPGYVWPYSPLAQAYPQYRDGERIWVDPNTGGRYRVQPRSWDRDGDGVSNRRDRRPDDPRYR